MQFRNKILPIILLVAMSLFAFMVKAQDLLLDKPAEMQVETKETTSSKDADHIRYITSKYSKISVKEATLIVETAHKNADPVYPKYEDIMAVTEVESAFYRLAKLGTCQGLMQLDYVYYGDKKHRRGLFDPETNIRRGAAHLNELANTLVRKHKTKKLDDTNVLSAYRTGLGDFLRGVRDRAYIAKVSKAKKNYM